MKMRTIGVCLAALALAALGSSALAKEQVPIKGEFATEFVFTAPPPVAEVTVWGEGKVSHLGQATCFSDDEVVDFRPLFAGTGLPTLTGTLTLTAANGDKLVGWMDAIAIPAPDGSITFFGVLIFLDGTGRFAGAEGVAALNGSGTPTSPGGGIGQFSIDGTVSSPGANKK